jgi:Holliday junction resolvasome RuvABC endonuclease subunit
MDQFARMHEIYEFFDKMVKSSLSEEVAIEKLYFYPFNSPMPSLYGVRGALAMLFRKHTIPIHEWTPQELKKYITGS